MSMSEVDVVRTVDGTPDKPVLQDRPVLPKPAPSPNYMCVGHINNWGWDVPVNEVQQVNAWTLPCGAGRNHETCLSHALCLKRAREESSSEERQLPFKDLNSASHSKSAKYPRNLVVVISASAAHKCFLMISICQSWKDATARRWLFRLGLYWDWSIGLMEEVTDPGL